MLTQPHLNNYLGMFLWASQCFSCYCLTEGNPRSGSFGTTSLCAIACPHSTVTPVCQSKLLEPAVSNSFS